MNTLNDTDYIQVDPDVRISPELHLKIIEIIDNDRERAARGEPQNTRAEIEDRLGRPFDSFIAAIFGGYRKVNEIGERRKRTAARRRQEFNQHILNEAAKVHSAPGIGQGFLGDRKANGHFQEPLPGKTLLCEQEIGRIRAEDSMNEMQNAR